MSMKLTRNGDFKVNFRRYTTLKESLLREILHYIKDRFPVLVRRARKAGFGVIANLSVTPRLIKDLPVLYKTFKDKKIDFRPYLLLGYYDGRVFPYDYSKPELECIKKHYYSEFEYRLGKSSKGLNYCHIMGFREKFVMSDEFVDLYYPKK